MDGLAIIQKPETCPDIRTVCGGVEEDFYICPDIV